MSDFMKTGDIISGYLVAELIACCGLEFAFVSGGEADIPAPSDIDADSAWAVVVNYGHGVQLHLQHHSRAQIVLRDLKGKVVSGEWVA